MTDVPDLSRLRRMLEKSVDLHAASERILDDPQGAALISGAESVMEQALDQGNVEVALKAWHHLCTLREAEEGLREAEATLAAADEAVRRVIGDPDGPQEE